MPLNFEFKVRCNNLPELENIIRKLNSNFIGEDHQTDTYFNVPSGRLKLREGNIENALIYYQRSDVAGAKESNVILYPHQPDTSLKKILSIVFGIKVVVEKIRHIYFLDNVKFHLDQVEGLGDFVEVEAIDFEGNRTLKELKKQCDYYIGLFGIANEQFIAKSYSDLLISNSNV